MGPADDYADQYARYLPRILNYVRLRVGDEAVAQDLTAAVFERAVSKQHTLRRRQALGAWLFSIARNVVAGYYRQRQHDEPLERAADQQADVLTPPEALMRRQELEQMLDALATLPEREQEIIRLKFAAGLGNQEIGSVMHLRAGHVAVLQYRALRRLRRTLVGEHSQVGKPSGAAPDPEMTQRSRE